MENKFKRFLSLALALLMIVSLVPVNFATQANAAEDTTTVYFQNNWLWTDVRAYYFDANNQVIGTAWPGSAMEVYKNDGTYDIYAAEVPANAAGVIFNGVKNDGSGTRDQTPDIKNWEGCQVFYMHWSDGNQTLTQEAKMHVDHNVDGNCTECGETAGHSWANGTCDCGATHETHSADYAWELRGEDYGERYCSVCGTPHVHTDWDADYLCKECGAPCLHPSYEGDGTCSTCGYCKHLTHSIEGICDVCEITVEHSYNNEERTCACGKPCPHETWREDNTCDSCGVAKPDDEGSDPTCDHNTHNVYGYCDVCFEFLGHAEFIDGQCPVCGRLKPAHTHNWVEDENYGIVCDECGSLKNFCVLNNSSYRVVVYQYDATKGTSESELLMIGAPIAEVLSTQKMVVLDDATYLEIGFVDAEGYEITDFGKYQLEMPTDKSILMVNSYNNLFWMQDDHSNHNMDGECEFCGKYVGHNYGEDGNCGCGATDPNYKVVAKINGSDNEYATLAAAVKAAQPDETVTLLADVTVDAYVTIDKAITLDLNGHSITRAGTADGACTLYITGSGVTVTDSQKPTDASAHDAAVKNTGRGIAIYIAEDGELTLTNVNVVGSDMGIYSEGNLTVDTNAYIKGTNTTSECGDGIRVYGGTVTVNAGGFVEAAAGGTAIELYKTAKVTMNGQIFAVQGNSYGIAVYGGELNYAGNIMAGEGTAILVTNDHYDQSYVTNGVVNITGGETNATTHIHVDNTKKLESYAPQVNISGGNMMDGEIAVTNLNNSVISITGGTYWHLDPSAYVAEGYVANYDGVKYTVSKKQVVEEVKPEELDPVKVEGKDVSVSVSGTESKTEIKEDVKTELENSGVNNESVQTAANATETTKSLVQAAAKVEDVQNVVSAAVEEKKATIAEVFEEDEKVEVEVRPYLDMTVTAFKPAEETSTATLKLSITAMYDVVAVADNKEAVLASGKTLETTEEITITIPLPEGFVTEGKVLKVKHTKDGVEKGIYDAEVSADGKTATFKNPHGFSEFELYTEDAGPMGDEPVAYVGAGRIWGETWSNATESYELKFYNDTELMGTTKLNPEVYDFAAMNGNVKPTWHISFDIASDNDTCWIQEWVVAPTVEKMPNRVELWVDGKNVNEGEVQFNGPDGLKKIVALVVDNKGTIKSAQTTLADALDAAVDGDTINLISGPDVVISAAGEVTGGKTVTITGTAQFDWTKGWLFVGRGNNAGDGKLIFANATITSSVKKNPATYGIYVSGAKADGSTATGILEIKNSSIEVDYLRNQNAVEIDNSTLTVYGGFSISGRGASDAAGGVDGTATIDIKNGSTVNVLNENGMGVGYEGNGVVILKDSTFKSNSITLYNDGGKSYFDVYGKSTLDVKLDSKETKAVNYGIVYLNGVDFDANTKITGKVRVRAASGTNNIDGSTIDATFFQVGIGAYNGQDPKVDTVNGVTVNVKNNAVISAGGSTYAGWVGTGYYDTDAEKAAAMTDAKYVLNIENSQATFGYLHVSNDGVLNVIGHTDNKYKSDGSTVDFYAGDFIINGVATFDNTDSWAKYTKVSCDNGTDKPGTLIVKNGAKAEMSIHNGGKSGTALVLYKTGIVEFNGATVEVDNQTSIAANAKLNVTDTTVTALGTVTNKGAIAMDRTSMLKAPKLDNSGTITIDAAGVEEGKNILVIDLSGTESLKDKVTVNNLGDASVSYGEDGDVTLCGPVYVAQNTATEKKYTSLTAAVEGAAEGDTITLIDDTTENVTIDNAVTIDANGKTINGSVLVMGNTTFKGTMTLTGNVKVTDGATLTIDKEAVVNGSTSFFGAGNDAEYYGLANGDTASGTIVINGTVDIQQINANAGGVVTVAEGGKLTTQIVCVENGGIDGAIPGVMNINGTVETQRFNVFGGATVNVGKTGYLSSEQESTSATLYDVLYVKGNSVLNIEGTVETAKVEHTEGRHCTMSVEEGSTVNINGGTLIHGGELTNEGTVNVSGESTLNIATLSGNSIDLLDGAIIKDSTVGGTVYVAGNVIFRGDNTVTMITDLGDYHSKETPSKWTVEADGSLTLTFTGNNRYGLGYGDQVTIYGTIEDALDAREGLSDADADVNMYCGLVGMTNSAAPNAQNKLTIQDAYVIFGVTGDKSFGNKANYYGNYDIDITNTVFTAAGFKFYEDNGTTDLNVVGSDLLVNGVFMTNDASSKFTFTDSVILSKATSNGTDDKNQNAGEINLINTKLTYNALVTNNGTIKMDTKSVLTAPSIAGSGKIIIDAAEIQNGDIGTSIQVIVGDVTAIADNIEVINGDDVTVTKDAQGVTLTRNATVAYVVDEEDNVLGKADTIAAAIKLAVENGSSRVKLSHNVVESMVMVNRDITLDLNGKTLDADYLVVFNGSSLVDNSTEKGLLKIEKNNISLPVNNAQMPVYNEVDGYHFVPVNVDQKYLNNSSTGLFKVGFRPDFTTMDGINKVAAVYFDDGAANNGIKFQIRMSWTQIDVDGNQNNVFQTFEFTDAMVNKVYSLSRAFVLDVTSIGSIKSLEINVIVVSETGVQAVSKTMNYTAK